MADISDVTAAIAAACLAILYPTGVATAGQNSVLGLPAKVFEGWPAPGQLDADAKASIINVSVFPVPGTTQALPQAMQAPFVVVPAVHGMVPSVNAGGTVLTVTGTPSAGEYLTVTVNKRKVYSRVGSTVAAVLSALLADVIADFSTATATASTLTIPGSHAMVARVGAPITLGQPIHRQADQVMVTVWAPDPASRSLYAAALDTALKTALTVSLPDTTEGIVRYQRTNISDHEQNKLIYRRDLVYAVEYFTIEQFGAFEITSVSSSTDAPITIVE